MLNTPDKINFTEQGGTQQVSFSTNYDWSVSSSESWLTVSSLSGLKSDGEISLSITCGPNSTYDSRTSVIVISAGDLKTNITVTQDSNIGLSVGQLSYSLDYTAQVLEIEVSANVNYSVDIDSSCQKWISLNSTKALSSNYLVFQIGSNMSLDAREGIITIKQTEGNLSQTVIVRQRAYDTSVLTSYVLLSFSSTVIQPIQILPASANWTILWGDGQYSLSGENTGHSFETEGTHTVLLSGSDITEFSTSVKGLEMIDYSNF